jgi:aryl-alcohol dehydrogenase-like predicted oxidoreductase
VRVAAWLDPAELRVALGCMRLGADGAAVIRAALDAGVTVLDTARAYGAGEHDLGANERLVADAVLAAGAGARVRIVSKCGMRRPGGGWRPDGRRVALRADVEASLAALRGLPIDLYLLHAPDPATPLATSVRALAALVDEGLVRRVGLCNVNRRQLDEALELAPIAAVQVALSPGELGALRGGVVERCAALGITVLAHSPLGGPGRAPRLARDPRFAAAAARLGVSAQEVALAWLRRLDAAIVPVAGATRVESAAALARAARLELGEEDAARLPAPHARPPAPPADSERRVVLVMGPQGAGKTTAAARWTGEGHERLNRDERGGTLRALARVLDARLAGGARRLVLDNTYLTRAQRREIIDAAWRHGAAVNGVWLDAPLEVAQANVVRRMLAHHGRLLEPGEMRRADRPESLPPAALLRARRELEPPVADEGFATLEVVPVAPRPSGSRAGVFVAAEALPAARWPAGEGAARLVFAWRPEGPSPEDEAFAAEAGATLAVCRHPGGPPTCWCRPPLPGLVLAFCAREDVDPTRSVLVGASPAHRALAAGIGARFEAI